MSTAITRFKGEYAFLSNFYPSPIRGRFGKVYPTVEHAFQAAKTNNADEREAIRTATTPGKAKRLGRQATLIPNWEEVKIDVMRYALQLKFQIPELRAALDMTYPRPLEEGNDWGDQYWGTVNGIGKNWLGHLLMEIRAEIRRNGI